MPWYRRFLSSPPIAVPDAVKRRAIEGDADAQFALGVYHGCTVGMEEDLETAATWYRRAAEQNHPLAEFNLSVMYAEGQGVARDQTEADRWLERAAGHGDAGAQYDLGIRCQRASLDRSGAEAVAARIEAYKWLRLAALQGYGQADLACQRLSLGMTRAEMDEGARRAELSGDARSVAAS